MLSISKQVPGSGKSTFAVELRKAGGSGGAGEESLTVVKRVTDWQSGHGT
jgi:hypothetical protein